MSETRTGDEQVNGQQQPGSTEGRAERGEFSADVPQDAVEAALRSVEGRGDEAPGEDAPDELTRLRAQLDQSQALGAKTQERLRETHERLMRLAADFDNFKKRAAREREETTKLANERLLKELLPVMDNLERALASNAEAAGFAEGVRLVARQFSEALGRNGAEGFSAVGQPFDPNRHEALMQQESAEVPAGHVVSELVKGYMLHDRLVRPAAVVVSSGPPAAAAEAPAEQKPDAAD